MLLLFPTTFSLVHAAVVCTILESISRLGTLCRYNGAQVLAACGCLKLLSVYLYLLVDAVSIACHQLGLLGL